MPVPAAAPPSLTVVTFFTEGFPHDGGMALGDTVAELRLALEGAGVPLVAFTPRLLSDDAYYRRHCTSRSQEHGEEPGMELLPNARSLGYYAWKPLVICRALARVPEGGMLLFMDANVRKYPQYLEGLRELPETCSAVLERCGADLFIPLEDAIWKRIRNHCKNYTLELMDANRFEVAYAPCICVNRILMRRTRQASAIMHDWLHWCSQDDVISPLPNPNPHPLTLFHTPEQAILAILLRKRALLGEFPPGWPFFSYSEGSRVFQLDSLEVWPLSSGRLFLRRVFYMKHFLTTRIKEALCAETDPFWKQFPRATTYYVLRLAITGFMMCFVPIPRGC